MNFEAVKAWLDEFVARRKRNSRIAGIAGICLMPVALAVAVALVFGILYMSAIHRTTRDPDFTPPSNAKLLAISVATIPFMFLVHWFARPKKNLLDQHIDSGDYATFTGHYTAKSKVTAQIFLWILCAGPQCLDWGLNSFREIKRLEQMDTHSCGAILWLLLMRAKKVPYEDIQKEFSWLNLDTTLPQLMSLEGVVALPTAPAGLSITQDLRDEIRSGIAG